VIATTSFNRLVAAHPHAAANVEASDPDIIMRRFATSERTMTPAMTSIQLSQPGQLRQGDRTNVPLETKNGNLTIPRN
jgi:hypothetical protein